MKEIYLAGGCFWGLEAVMRGINGVVDTEVGYVNSQVENPTYEMVCSGTTGAAEAVKVTYNPKKTDLTDILRIFFLVINPFSKERQGNDVGPQYRTGIYYTSKEDEPILQYYMNFMQQRGKSPAITDSDIIMNEEADPYHGQKIVTELLRLENFYPAEESHQDYLEKNPDGYCHIDLVALRAEGIIS